MRHLALALSAVLTLSAAGVALAAARSTPFFQGAPAASPVSFQALNLPPPSPSPTAGDLPLARSFAGESPFTPPLARLLTGELVLTNDRQMRAVWERLFDVPYDSAQFDFSSTFVVLMGGGWVANGSFEISAVEEVQATYANPGGPDGETALETFLSVTATTFLNGAQPEDPPPPTLRLSAVKIARARLDDVVFRRNFVLGG